MYTHTLATNTERFVITFWREKIIHRFKLQQMVKKKPNRYSSQNLLKETMKKRSTLASNTSSFNGCLRLTWVSTSCQAIIELKVVRYQDINPGGGKVRSYINLPDIAL